MARILVIDDDEVIRMLLARALASDGYEVQAAQDGLKGMALFKAAPADVVITDIYMPNQEGLATIMELRRLSPSVKIVAMSGGGALTGMDVLPVAEALGAEATLRKPFTPTDVKALMRVLLAESGERA